MGCAKEHLGASSLFKPSESVESELLQSSSADQWSAVVLPPDKVQPPQKKIVAGCLGMSPGAAASLPMFPTLTSPPPSVLHPFILSGFIYSF